MPEGKIRDVELAISTQKGEFELFGIFLRDDSAGRWDLIVSAPWLRPHDRESLEVVASGLQGALSPNELLGISRIVILEKGNTLLESILSMFDFEHGFMKVERLAYSGVTIREACIITAKRRLARKGRRSRNNSPAK